MLQSQQQDVKLESKVDRRRAGLDRLVDGEQPTVRGGELSFAPRVGLAHEVRDLPVLSELLFQAFHIAGFRNEKLVQALCEEIKDELCGVGLERLIEKSMHHRVVPRLKRIEKFEERFREFEFLYSRIPACDFFQRRRRQGLALPINNG